MFTSELTIRPRYNSKSILIARGILHIRLRERFPEIGEKPDARTVFVRLRELRNSW
jgi:hydroxyacylglutathione hydrolase